MQLKVTNKQPDCLVICISTLFSRPLHIFLTFESFYLSIGAKCPCFAISLIDWSCFIYFKLFFKLLTSFCLRISSIPSKHNFFSFLLPLHPLILFLVYFIFDLMYLFFVGDQSNSIDFFNFACFLLYPINAYSIFILFFFTVVSLWTRCMTCLTCIWRLHLYLTIEIMLVVFPYIKGKIVSMSIKTREELMCLRRCFTEFRSNGYEIWQVIICKI